MNGESLHKQTYRHPKALKVAKQQRLNTTRQSGKKYMKVHLPAIQQAKHTINTQKNTSDPAPENKVRPKTEMN